MALFRHKKQIDNIDDIENTDLVDTPPEEDFEVAPEAIGISKEEISNIEDIITETYSGLANDAFRNRDPKIRKNANDELIDILTNHNDFQDFHTHNNEELSKLVSNEITGLGIIGQIMKHYPDANDIGFDGRHLIISSRKKTFMYDGKDVDGKPLINNDVAKRFIQIIAKYVKKGFNETNPTLNCFMMNMRISATYGSLTADGNVTFAIRISKTALVLNEDNFNGFANPGIYPLLKMFVKAHSNIILNGGTGVGKTQVQKLLCASIPQFERMIVVEDVPETNLFKLFPNKDIFSWMTKEKNQLGSNKNAGLTVTIADQVKQALRNNPRWLIVAETRGEEAFDMQEGAKSDHNVITTLHSRSNKMVASRFVSMIMRGISNLDVERARMEFLDIMHIGIHISKKKIDGKIYRYLDDLSVFVPESKEHPFGVVPIYTAVMHNDLTRTCKTYKMPDKIIDLFEKELDETDLVGKMLREYNLDFSGNGHSFTDSVPEI